MAGPPLAEFEMSELDGVKPIASSELRALAIEGWWRRGWRFGEHAEVIGALTGLVAADPIARASAAAVDAGAVSLRPARGGAGRVPRCVRRAR